MPGVTARAARINAIPRGRRIQGWRSAVVAFATVIVGLFLFLGWAGAGVSAAGVSPAGTPSAYAYFPLVFKAPPTSTPTPTATPTQPSQGGLEGQLSLVDNKPTYATFGEWIKFYELLHNPTSSNVRYGILGVNVTGPVNLPFKTSWDGAGAPGGMLTINAGCYGPGGGTCAPNPDAGRAEDHVGDDWNDHSLWEITLPGRYTIAMYVCLSPFSTCVGGGGDWRQIGSVVTFDAIQWTPQAPGISLFEETRRAGCYLSTADPSRIYLSCPPSTK